jgi:hypothetical protein
MSGKEIDERPGPVPDIRADGDSVIYLIEIPTESSRLIIRCDPDGAVVASIVGPASA